MRNSVMPEDVWLDATARLIEKIIRLRNSEDCELTISDRRMWVFRNIVLNILMMHTAKEYHFREPMIPLLFRNQFARPDCCGDLPNFSLGILGNVVIATGPVNHDSVQQAGVSIGVLQRERRKNLDQRPYGCLFYVTTADTVIPREEIVDRANAQRIVTFQSTVEVRRVGRGRTSRVYFRLRPATRLKPTKMSKVTVPVVNPLPYRAPNDEIGYLYD